MKFGWTVIPQTKRLVILDHFCPFTLLAGLTIKILKKKKRTTKMFKSFKRSFDFTPVYQKL